jgi:DeoR family transcriptional regulator, fructose operon transcriptional repressor
MNFQKRKQVILATLESVGEADIKTLAAELKVAEITIRRDLNVLAEDGLLYRTHGGAMKVSEVAPAYPFANKAAVRVAAKEAICRRAAALVEDGAILFMDCGSTVFHLCPFIRNKRVQVITNSLPVVYALQNSRAAVNIIGGELDMERQAVHGKMAEQHIRQYRATMAFLGVDGISSQGLFANSEKEAAMSLSLAAQSKRSCLLFDASKLGRESYLRFSGLELIDTVVTDAAAADCRFLKKAGIRVLLGGS